MWWEHFHGTPPYSRLSVMYTHTHTHTYPFAHVPEACHMAVPGAPCIPQRHTHGKAL